MNFDFILGATTKELEQFRAVCNQLLSRTYVVRTLYRPGKGRINNPDYTFLSLHYEAVQDYLGLLDWDLRHDKFNGYFYVINTDEANRCNLSKKETAILLALRMIYEENQERLGLEQDAVCTVRDVLEKVVTDYLRSMEITNEVKDMDDQLSKLDLLWLDEQRRTITALGSEIIALNKEKEQLNIQIGKDREHIRQLDYDVLPNHYQQLSKTADELQERFAPAYQENTGIPRYQQELSRLKHADIVHKNFSNRLEQSVNEQNAAQRKLFAARREYTDRFKPCSFRVEVMDNDEFEAEQRLLEESELPKYREKIKAARESAMEQFQNDFLAKLKSSIDQVQDQVKNLNRALRQAQFGTDSYQFRVERNPDYAEYYDMIMDPELMEGDVGLFARPFQDKYGQLIEKLFSQITTADDTQLNARKQSELQENIQRYTDFRTYLKFDLETTDQNGTKQLLSQTLNTKSGGETQTPFYIAVLASFAQLYRVNDTSSFGNTVRLAVFDEAFNKMDSDRIIESVRLLRRMGLQAIICTPPDKVSDIMPIADRTLLVNKDKYRMHILPFGKEIAQ